MMGAIGRLLEMEEDLRTTMGHSATLDDLKEWADEIAKAIEELRAIGGRLRSLRAYGDQLVMEDMDNSVPRLVLPKISELADELEAT